MYKILLIDEQEKIVKELKILVNSLFNNLCDVHMIIKSEKMINVINDLEPDIIFLDLKFSNIDMFEIIREVKQRNPNVKIIVLSETEKIENIKLSLNLGVFAFLDKPMKSSDVEKTLKRAIDCVNSIRIQKIKNEIVQKKINEMLPVLEKHFIDELLFHKFYIRSIEKMKLLFGIEQNFGFLMLLNIKNKKIRLGDKSWNMLMEHNYTEFCNCIKNYIAGIPGDYTQYGLPVFVPIEDEIFEEVFRCKLVSQIKKMMYSFYETYGIEFQVAIGNIYLIEDVTCSFQEAVEARDKSEKKIVFYEELGTDSSISRALQYIEDNFKENISLNDVAEEIEISPYYLSKLFKSKIGVNYIDYLTNVRLSYAKQMLSETDESIQNICLTSGYMDPNYFSRIFKKHVGVTPRQYKETHQK